MTITEQLQFSVLTAPVATLDRRTLSQAWYSALYGGRKKNAAPQAQTASPAMQTATARGVHGVAARNASEESRAALALRGIDAKTPAHADGTPQDRRAPRSPLARKMERAFLRPRSTSQKASFTVDGDHGRVHVLLRTQGSQLKLIAICPPKARPHVAAALAQARYALAMRGIDLEADARSEAQC